MNISIFNRDYWIRRYGEVENVDGYLIYPHEDFLANIHVHPVGANSLQMFPEGDRMTKRLEGHGMVCLYASDHDEGVKGDMLYYKGRWYECTSSVEYDHTLLNHYNYVFTIVPKDAAGSVDLDPPNE